MRRGTLTEEQERQALAAGACWYRVRLLGLRYAALFIGQGRTRRLLDYRGPLDDEPRRAGGDEQGR